MSSSAFPNQPRVDNVIDAGGMVGAKILWGGRRIRFCVHDDDDNAKYSGSGCGAGGGYIIVMEENDDDVSSFITTIVVIISTSLDNGDDATMLKFNRARGVGTTNVG